MNRRRQYGIYATLALAACVSTAALMPAGEVHFRRYFGPADPLLVLVSVAVIGALALGALHAAAGFVIVRGRETLRGLGWAGAAAMLMGIAIVTADLALRYPRDINVPLPQAVLFYPAIALVAEVVFHLAPLALLLAVVPRWRRRQSGLWLPLLLVALIEPAFQVAFEAEPLSARAAYTALHVLLIGAGQMYLYWRFDFVTMLALRLFYYGIWHLLWGALRLELLF